MKRGHIYIYIYKYIWTSRLLDQIGPVGRFDEKQGYYCDAGVIALKEQLSGIKCINAPVKYREPVINRPCVTGAVLQKAL